MVVLVHSFPMRKAHFNFGKALSRRTLLRGAGVALGLPLLDSMTPAFAAASSGQPKAKRFVAVTLSLGLHGPNLVPAGTGRDYKASRYLEPLQDLREDFTVVSGSSHPGVTGGHRAEGNILSACPNEGGSNSRSSISLDQLMARELGHQTRFPSLVLNTGGTTSPSYTENGSMIPAERDARKLFMQLFIDEDARTQRRQAELIQRGRSIMDLVGDEAKRLQRELGPGDRDRLDSWFTSVRETERRLELEENWVKRPKPKPGIEAPFIGDRNNAAAVEKTMLDIVHLALATDSTRFVNLHVTGTPVTGIEGVDEGYHTLSHHGRDEEKIRQLSLVEGALVREWGSFLRTLKTGNLLDETMVLMTSNLGNASAHENRNMPVLFAGGGFRHGQHLAFDQYRNYPLPNLFLGAAQQAGLEIDQFATSTGTMRGLESKA